MVQSEEAVLGSTRKQGAEPRDAGKGAAAGVLTVAGGAQPVVGGGQSIRMREPSGKEDLAEAAPQLSAAEAKHEADPSCDRAPVVGSTPISDDGKRKGTEDAPKVNEGVIKKVKVKVKPQVLKNPQNDEKS